MSRASLGLVLLVAATGCLPLGRGAPSGWGGDAHEDRFTLEVDNRNFREARLYARWNGERQRIGNVGGNQSGRFTLRWRPVQLRVEVDFVAAGGFVSDAVPVNPGDTVVFRIPASVR